MDLERRLLRDSGHPPVAIPVFSPQRTRVSSRQQRTSETPVGTQGQQSARRDGRGCRN